MTGYILICHHHHYHHRIHPPLKYSNLFAISTVFSPEVFIRDVIIENIRIMNRYYCSSREQKTVKYGLMTFYNSSYHHHTTIVYMCVVYTRTSLQSHHKLHHILQYDTPTIQLANMKQTLIMRESVVYIYRVVIRFGSKCRIR